MCFMFMVWMCYCEQQQMQKVWVCGFFLQTIDRLYLHENHKKKKKFRSDMQFMHFSRLDTLCSSVFNYKPSMMHVSNLKL